MVFLKNKRLSILYILFVAVYVWQTLNAPIDKTLLAKYNINSGQLKLISLTVIIPYIIIWLIALTGYIRINSYVTFIKKDKDGKAFKSISQGILALTLWLPISTIVTNYFKRAYIEHHAATANLIRLDNYLNMLILLGGFLLIYKGSNNLLMIIKKPKNQSSLKFVLIYIIFAALYVFLTLHDSARQFPTKSVATAAYYESDWLIVLTLVIPRLIYWFIGAQAVQNIFTYRKNVKGKLYKHALNRLAQGIAGVVTATIVLRCYQSLSDPLAKLNLGLILAVVYLLLIGISTGYILIAKGAKNLQQLEEL